MRLISPRVQEALNEEPDICARRYEGGCAGRITREHAVIYAGRQVDEVWAIIKLCERHHAVNNYQDRGVLDKEKNLWIALHRATDEELIRISKAIDYIRERDRLNQKYGIYQNKTNFGQ